MGHLRSNLSNSFQRSLQRYFKRQNSKINFLIDQDIVKLRKILLFKKIIALMPRKIYPILKKSCYSAPMNLAIETLETLQRTDTKRLKKSEQPVFLQRNVGWASRKNVLDCMAVRWTERPVMYSKQPWPRVQQHYTSESVNHDEQFQPGTLWGDCVGKQKNHHHHHHHHQQKHLIHPIAMLL